ncbi:coiled-coil domain-containing protein-domain-containing protein [Scenedesmus sp. NREL 46B-D3]|nr:coiled-coil domain-containing protein-domain-containing protein [Scenedesmus sp. NREL 46B-D3]
MAATPALENTLDAAFCAALCTRLSTVPDLQLPSSLCRQQPELGPEAIQTFLQALLQRDPAVFLERYSSLFSSSDLDGFEPLRGNYEVNYWLHLAEQQRQHGAGSQQEDQEQQQQQQRAAANVSGRNKAASKTAANRRLAFMYKLEQQGEYFSDSSMRAREPLVWHEYIGQYEGQPPPAAGAQPGGGLGLAGSLLSAHDEVLVRARLQQQLQEAEGQMSEQEESDDEGEQQADAADRQEAAKGEGSIPQQRLQQHQQQKQQRDAVPGVGDELMQDAGGGAGSSSAATPPQQQQQQQQQQQGDMSAGAMRRRRQEFLEEMQSRFLLGLDGEHQEYADIDGDAGLDEAWAAQQAQDAEDAYFDAD